jgi:hypothetical protein
MIEDAVTIDDIVEKLVAQNMKIAVTIKQITEVCTAMMTRIEALEYTVLNGVPPGILGRSFSNVSHETKSQKPKTVSKRKTKPTWIK